MDNIGELEDDAPQPNLSEDGRFVILDQSQNLSVSHEQNKSANQEHNGSESEAWSLLHKLWACLPTICRIHSDLKIRCAFTVCFCGCCLYECTKAYSKGIEYIYSSRISTQPEGVWYYHCAKKRNMFEKFFPKFVPTYFTILIYQVSQL